MNEQVTEIKDSAVVVTMANGNVRNFGNRFRVMNGVNIDKNQLEIDLINGKTIVIPAPTDAEFVKELALEGLRAKLRVIVGSTQRSVEEIEILIKQFKEAVANGAVSLARKGNGNAGYTAHIEAYHRLLIEKGEVLTVAEAVERWNGIERGKKMRLVRNDVFKGALVAVLTERGQVVESVDSHEALDELLA